MATQKRYECYMILTNASAVRLAALLPRGEQSA